MTDYTELKRLAEAAAQGQDTWCAAVPEGATINPTGAALLIGPRRRDLDRMVAYVREDAEFIAAANPAAILALIAENERLRDSHEQVCTNYNKVSYASEERGKQINQLKAEVEALRKDAERYRWLRDYAWLNEKGVDHMMSLDYPGLQKAAESPESAENKGAEGGHE